MHGASTARKSPLLLLETPCGVDLPPPCDEPSRDLEEAFEAAFRLPCADEKVENTDNADAGLRSRLN